MLSLFLAASLPDKGNGPFSSCFEPHYEGEASCIVFIMKISLLSYANETNFHIKIFVTWLRLNNEVQATIIKSNSPGK